MSTFSTADPAPAFSPVVEVAKGILMQLRGCNADEAFELLRAASHRDDRLVRDVAQTIVDAAEGRATARPWPH
jgi:AmiR/NasT family two-component response regulator